MHPRDPLELVRRSWPDLVQVARRYTRFIAQFSGEPAPPSRIISLDGRDAFRTCFAAISEYRRCLRVDPELPPELLPSTWPSGAARELFERVHRELIGRALAHFDARVREGRSP